MPRVRRRTKAILLVDPQDILYLDIGMPPRVDGLDGNRWRRLWARRWPTEGAALMRSLPHYSFAYALATFGDPRRRRSTPPSSTQPEEETPL